MRKSEGQGPQSFSNSAVKILRGIEGVGVELFRLTNSTVSSHLAQS